MYIFLYYEPADIAGEFRCTFGSIELPLILAHMHNSNGTYNYDSVFPTNQHGWTALHHASNWGYVSCVEKLLDLGADPYAQVLTCHQEHVLVPAAPCI